MVLLCILDSHLIHNINQLSSLAIHIFHGCTIIRTSISDCSWYELTRQLEYKSAWNSREYIKVDTYFASSQLCNVCGYKNKETKNLNVREWICPECGTRHDRDINAAINVLNKGLEMLKTA